MVISMAYLTLIYSLLLNSYYRNADYRNKNRYDRNLYIYIYINCSFLDVVKFCKGSQSTFFSVHVHPKQLCCFSVSGSKMHEKFAVAEDSSKRVLIEASLDICGISSNCINSVGIFLSLSS